MINPLHQTWAAVAATLLVTACSGVPLASLPRLAAMQSELLDANPAEIMLAVQEDERMVPPPDAVPTLNIELRAREPGAFEPWQRKLPMRMSTQASPPGLPPAGRGRRWLVYSLAPASQSEFALARSQLAEVKTRREGKSGGSLGVGIAQEGIAANDPLLARTPWKAGCKPPREQAFSSCGKARWKS